MLQFHFIRHAQSEGNVRPALVGGQSSHYPLTDLGQAQARLLAARYAKKGLAESYKIYSSTAVRARQTAAAFCAQFGIEAELELSDALLELSQGDWTGLVRADVYTPLALQQIKADAWHFSAPNGESQSDVGRRIYLWLRAQIALVGDTDMTFYVFTHGVAIKSILRELFGFDASHTYKINIENTSITRVDYTAATCFSLHKVNDYGHLE
jgi:broad specificity phosphatase PhoE